ncbi:hypothetical protein AIOL_003190 [Candidatus Rhodobacter oscarellae]|uniref:Uncharacterized protein n=1 Tax=Candidatus Rhodobacter oscarellae TaxID=1675527 RepID=A0A0J9E975_9RHOB|nr:hypothetical protein AIOL_003190 [Candidatus Rhodobacter lobularis]
MRIQISCKRFARPFQGPEPRPEAGAVSERIRRHLASERSKSFGKTFGKTLFKSFGPAKITRRHPRGSPARLYRR